MPLRLILTEKKITVIVCTYYVHIAISSVIKLQNMLKKIIPIKVSAGVRCICGRKVVYKYKNYKKKLKRPSSQNSLMLNINSVWT